MSSILIPRRHYTQPQGRVVLDWGSYLLAGARHVVMGGLVAPYQQGFSPMLRIGDVGEGVTPVGTGARGSGIGNTSNADRYVVVGQSGVSDHTTVALYVPANISDQSRSIAIRHTTSTDPTSLGVSIRAGFGQNGADLEFYLRRAVRFVAPGVLEPGVPVVAAISGTRFYVNGGDVGGFTNTDNPPGAFGYCGGNGGSGNGTLLLCVEYPEAKGAGFVGELSKIFLEAPFQLFRADPARIFSLPSGGGATADGVTLSTAMSLSSGAASGAASAGGQLVGVAASLVPGAATGAGAGAAPGALISCASACLSGVAAGQALADGAVVPANLALVSGAAAGAGAAPGQSLAVSGSLLPGAVTGAAAAAGATLSLAASLLPGAVTAGGAASAPGVTLATAASLAPGAATGAAAAAGALLVASHSLIPGAASAGVTGNAGGATLTASVSLLAGPATGAAAASGQALLLGASLLPGAATAGAAGVAPGATFTTGASLVPGAASGAASVPARSWQAFMALITGAATGESAGSQPASAPGAEFVSFLALLEGEASGVVLDDYPMKYATLADMVTRYGQAELIQLTDHTHVPPAHIDTTRVQIAIQDAQMEIDSAIGRIYRLPLAGCIRPPVPPGTEPTAVAPPQLTRLACDIARFFLYDDLAPENEVVRRYKQAKATLDDIAAGALELACPWGGSPGELIAADAQSGSPEAYDCFAPRQITDDTLRGF